MSKKILSLVLAALMIIPMLTAGFAVNAYTEASAVFAAPSGAPVISNGNWSAFVSNDHMRETYASQPLAGFEAMGITDWAQYWEYNNVNFDALENLGYFTLSTGGQLTIKDGPQQVNGLQSKNGRTALVSERTTALDGMFVTNGVIGYNSAFYGNHYATTLSYAFSEEAISGTLDATSFNEVSGFAAEANGGTGLIDNGLVVTLYDASRAAGVNDGVNGSNVFDWIGVYVYKDGAIVDSEVFQSNSFGHAFGLCSGHPLRTWFMLDNGVLTLHFQDTYSAGDYINQTYTLNNLDVSSLKGAAPVYHFAMGSASDAATGGASDSINISRIGYGYVEPTTGKYETVETEDVYAWAGNTVAHVTSYAELLEVISGVNAGKITEVVFDADIDLASTVTVQAPAGQTVSFDLNGHTLTSSAATAIKLLEGNLEVFNGTVDVVGEAFRVNGRAGTPYLYVKSGLTVDSETDCCVYIYGAGAKLKTKADLTSHGVYATIQGNGTATDAITSIEVTGGTITSTASGAMYLPQGGTTTIKSATITGTVAVYLKSGALTISSGTFNATGDKKDYNYDGNGANPTGEAVIIDACGYPCGNPVVTIKGGTFTSANADAIGYYKVGENALANEQFITGGTFDSDVTAYMAAGYVQNSAGKVVKPASIAKVNYDSLAQAFEAAVDGNTIKLNADITLDAALNVTLPEDANVILDLNGFTISSTANAATALILLEGNLTVKNGTVDAEKMAFRVNGKDGGAPNLTLASNLTVDSATMCCVYAYGEGAVLNTAANLTSHGVYATIQGNGTAVNAIEAINVTGGSVVSTVADGIAMYLPQGGDVTVSGGTITGDTALYRKSGSLTITGGTFNGTGEVVEFNHDGNGAEPMGDAVTIEACGYPCGNPVVSITGGTFTSANGEAVGYYEYNGNAVENKQFISGGTFNTDVSALLADTYLQNADGVVGVAPVLIDNAGYATLAEAFAAAADGDTIALTADVALDTPITLADAKAVTLDLNGFTVTSAANAFIVTNGELTAKNGTVDATGYAFRVDGTANAANLVLDATLDVISETRQCIYPFGAGATVTTAADLTTNDIYAVIATNGNKPINALNITGGNVTANASQALYLPAGGTTTITGGTFTGTTAVYVKSGTINISGGTFIANGENVEYDYSNNGSSDTGDALTIDACGYPCGNPVVSITGGTFTSANGEAVGYYKYADNALANEKFITGGVFNTDVSAFLPEGYLQAEDGTVDTHVHEYVEEITTAATCDADGLKTFTCSVCGDSYTEVIPAIGHNYSWVETRAPVIANNGTPGVESYVCANCGDVASTRIVCALIFNAGAGTFDDDTSVKVYRIHPGQTYTDAIGTAPVATLDGHEFQYWDYSGVYGMSMNDGYGLNTSGEFNAIWSGHTYEWQITTAPTASVAGVESEVCTLCGAIGSTRPIYGIKLDPNGGTLPEGTGDFYNIHYNEHYVDVFTTDTTPVKEGYTFDGWKWMGYLIELTEPTAYYALQASATIKASWKEQTFAVTFDANGGTGAPSTQAKSYFSDLTISATAPEKAGAEFLGWKAADGTMYQPGDVYSTNEALALTAVWSMVPATVTSTNANGDYAITVANTTDVESVRYCVGSFTSYKAMKASGSYKSVSTINGDVVIGAAAGTFTVCIEYADGTLTYQTVSIDEYVRIDPIGITGTMLTITPTTGIRVIRFAEGTWSTAKQVRAAAGVRSISKNIGESVNVNLAEGTYTVYVEYLDGTFEIKTVTAEKATGSAGGTGTITFATDSTVSVVRYAMGTYRTASALKKGTGYKSVSKNLQPTMTFNVAAGTYTTYIGYTNGTYEISTIVVD